MRPLLGASCSVQNSVLSKAAAWRERRQLLAKGHTASPAALGA